MKAQILTISLAAGALTLGAGCGTTQTQRGATAGAATGAAIGGLIGANSSRVSTEGGAAIGAVAGGLAGAAIGNQAEKRADQRAATQTADVGYTVQSIPPAPVSEPQETIPPKPASNAVWIRGHYAYTGSGYQWQSGRWEIPPAGTSTYVPASWQPAANGGYVYVRGHWQ